MAWPSPLSSRPPPPSRARGSTRTPRTSRSSATTRSPTSRTGGRSKAAPTSSTSGRTRGGGSPAPSTGPCSPANPTATPRSSAASARAAWASADLAPIDPEAWVIVDGRLYLHYDKEGRDETAADPEARHRCRRGEVGSAGQDPLMRRRDHQCRRDAARFWSDRLSNEGTRAPQARNTAKRFSAMYVALVWGLLCQARCIAVPPRSDLIAELGEPCRRDGPRGARHRARPSRHKLVFGGSGRTRTMMQPCASAAKLRGGGPILHRGSRAMLPLGSPPPRIVIGGPPWTVRRAAEASLVPGPPGHRSRRRAQDDAFRRLAGRHQPPQRDEQLARQRHDQGLARAAAGVRGPRPVPARQRAVLLEAAGSARPAGSCRGAPGRCPPWRAPSPAASTRSRPARR